MSRYLAIDAEQGRLYLASAAVKGSAITVEKALAIPDVGTLTAANAGELGRRLKDALKDADIAPAPVLISVGREKTVLKEIKFPASATPVEEASLVRFQVAKEMTEGGDNVVVDYFAQPVPDSDGQRRALAFVIRKDVLAPLKALCAAAGLKLAGITPRPFGVAAALLRAIKDGAVTPPDSPSAPLAILVRGDKWGELVIVRGGQVAFTRSLTGVSLASETSMLGEIRRNLAVFSGPSSLNQVQALFVAEGDLPGGWTGRLKGGFTIPVQSFDPIAGTATDVPAESHGAFAGPVGLMALRARSPELPLNFLSPREPKPVSDPNKRLLGLIGVAAAILIVGGLLLGLFIVNQKQSREQSLAKQKAELEEDLKKLDDVQRRVKAVKDWEDKGVNWLDELYDLTARFPDPTKIEVVQLLGTPYDGKNAKTKHVAQMELKVATTADSVKSVDELINRIALDQKHFSVGAKQTSRNSTPGGGFSNRKNQEFSFKALIERREPSAYIEKLTTSPVDSKGGGGTRPERKRGSGAQSMNGGVETFGGQE